MQYLHAPADIMIMVIINNKEGIRNIACKSLTEFI